MKLEKQELSLTELENITAGWEFGSFCAGAMDRDFRGPIASFFNGLYEVTDMTGKERDTCIVCTKAIFWGAIAAATTAFLCVKRIPQKLRRKFSNWIDK